MSLSGRVALVTGGGKGLGEAIARRLAAEGAKVAVLGRDTVALHAVARSIEGLALEADVTDHRAVEAAVAKVNSAWGGIAILVQNAGIAESAKLEDTTDEIWDHLFAVNVTSAFRIARTVAPGMVKAGFGRIVHVASNAGLTGYAFTSAYCASKHALVGLTRALAVELARTGVTVNAVCPGFVDTEMSARAVRAISEKTGRSPELARKALEDLSPQRRLVLVDEVAHIVAMLCDDRARSVNGQAIAIDGGQVTK